MVSSLPCPFSVSPVPRWCNFYLLKLEGPNVPKTDTHLLRNEYNLLPSGEFCAAELPVFGIVLRGATASGWLVVRCQ
jgi:hypothetical protein